MALAGLGFQGRDSKFVSSTRDIPTTLRRQPRADEGSNFLTSSMLPGEVVEVVGFDGGDWVQVRLVLSGVVGWVRGKYLRPCPEGTRVHDRLTANPGDVSVSELSSDSSRFKELQAILRSADTHRRGVQAKRILHIRGHFLGETGMVTGEKEVLFHGTKDEAAKSIVAGGFDDHYSSAGAFGDGIYFSPHACKSMNYTGNFLIVAEVALGLEENRLTCTSTRRELTYDIVFRQLGKRSCQCHVGAPFNHEERVVYHPTQCKPVYLIELEAPGRLVTGKGC